MAVVPLTDEELAVVAAVARREGWVDLARPPEQHPPRSLAEVGAVGRFAASLPGRSSRIGTALRARLAMAALAVLVLGICWWMSPARTAAGLIVAGLVSLFALRRSRRRERAGRPAPVAGARRSPWGTAVR